MTEVKIEKNIPIPRMGRGKFGRYAEEMDVGDSILFIDDDTGFKAKYADGMCQSVIRALKSSGKDGTKRRMNNDRPKHWRVWRTK